MAGTCIYDGDCGFCTQSAKWLERHGDCLIVPWQALDLSAVGLTEADVTSYVHWQDGSGRVVARGGQAVAAALRTCARPWRWLGLVLSLGPVRPLTALGYRIVAANRYRLPGATDACRIG